MEGSVIKKNDKTYLPIIWVLSVAIPVVVALLLFMPKSGSLGDLNVSFLPQLNAILNTATAVMLIAGFIAIKNQKQELHKTFMMSAFALSSVFLICYVAYHFLEPSTKFGDIDANGVVDATELAAVGAMRMVYLIILLTHILLATAVVPLVLFSIYFAMSGQLPRHKKIVKWTYPIWLYVAITGPIVYLMISPYYPHS